MLGSALKLHDADIKDVRTRWPRGQRNIAEVLGISKTQFWSKIEEIKELLVEVDKLLATSTMAVPSPP